uniref:Uncharacterized protein n=1 Tax=Arundo donax TaxID=35708 RepID=A0A0A9B890_ARUDO
MWHIVCENLFLVDKGVPCYQCAAKACECEL